jgi:hypothetical protein
MLSVSMLRVIMLIVIMLILLLIRVVGRVVKRVKKIPPNFGKSSQNNCQAQNCQNIYIKAQFESPKHLHKNTL